MSVMVAVQQRLLIEGADVHDVADAIMEHLVLLSEAAGSQVLDSAVDADSSDSTIAIEVTVSGDDLGAAVNVASGAMRTAIHATGGRTADWITAADLQSLVDSIGHGMRLDILEPAAA